MPDIKFNPYTLPERGHDLRGSAEGLVGDHDVGVEGDIAGRHCPNVEIVDFDDSGNPPHDIRNAGRGHAFRHALGQDVDGFLEHAPEAEQDEQAGEYADQRIQPKAETEIRFFNSGPARRPRKPDAPSCRAFPARSDRRRVGTPGS